MYLYLGANKWIYKLYFMYRGRAPCWKTRYIQMHTRINVYGLHLICVEIVSDCHSLCGYAYT